MFEINLLPWRERYQAKRQTDFYKSLLAFLLIGFGIAYGYHLYVNQQRQQAQVQLQDLMTEQRQVEEKLQQLRAYETQQTTLQTKLDGLDALDAQRYVMAMRLDALPDLLNEGIMLERIASDASSMSVNGIGLDEFSVSTFMRALDESDMFGGSGLNFIQETQMAKQNAAPGEEQAQVLRFNLKVDGDNG